VIQIGWSPATDLEKRPSQGNGSADRTEEISKLTARSLTAGIIFRKILVIRKLQDLP